MNCPKCGKFCAENQTFCLGCGSPLETEAKNQTLDFDINNYNHASKFGESNPNLNNNQNINNNVSNQNVVNNNEPNKFINYPNPNQNTNNNQNPPLY